jgi:four helix bundle protein
MAFLFEKLDVYKKSLAWSLKVDQLVRGLNNKITSTFADQLHRAALSIPLNVAEGNGRWHKPDKRQFFWIARGSVFECVPLIEILYQRKLLPVAEYASHRLELEEIAKMLTGLIQFTERAA